MYKLLESDQFLEGRKKNLPKILEIMRQVPQKSGPKKGSCGQTFLEKPCRSRKKARSEAAAPKKLYKFSGLRKAWNGGRAGAGGCAACQIGGECPVRQRLGKGWAKKKALLSSKAFF
nr:hypothetical protein [uncultured Gemmiger sp.]